MMFPLRISHSNETWTLRNWLSCTSRGGLLKALKLNDLAKNIGLTKHCCVFFLSLSLISGHNDLVRQSQYFMWNAHAIRKMGSFRLCCGSTVLQSNFLNMTMSSREIKQMVSIYSIGSYRYRCNTHTHTNCFSIKTTKCLKAHENVIVFPFLFRILITSCRLFCLLFF